MIDNGVRAILTTFFIVIGFITAVGMFNELQASLIKHTSLLNTTSDNENTSVWAASDITVFCTVIAVVIIGICIFLCYPGWRKYMKAKKAYSAKLRAADEIATALLPAEMIFQDVLLYAIELPQAKAKLLLKSVELLRIRTDKARLAYTRYVTESTPPTLRKAVEWYTTEVVTLDFIIARLKKCQNEWHNLNLEVQALQEGTTPAKLNERLLVLEVGLENARKALPAKLEFGIKVERIIKCSNLVKQVASLRDQLENQTITNWEIHTSLEAAEEKARQLAPTQFPELAVR